MPGEIQTSNSALVKITLGFLVLFLWFSDGFAFYDLLVQGKGTSFDLYLPWYGSQEIIQGRDPYTESVTEQIQIGTLRHIAALGENQYRFVYPAYVAFLLLPFLPLPFSLAATVWIVLQQVLVIVALALTWQALNWRPPLLAMIAIIAIGIVFRYSLIAIVLAQNSMVIVCLLAAALYASSRDQHAWAAVALALATFKPQLAAFPILGWLVLTLARRERHALIVFAVAMLVLVALPVPFIGNWVTGWWNSVSAYWGYTDSQSPLTLLVSFVPKEFASRIALVCAIIGAGYLAWIASHKGEFASVLGWSVLLTLVIVPLSSVYDLALLVLPWLIGWIAVRARRGVDARVLQIVLIVLPVLSWAIILIIPNLFDVLRLRFDAVTMDKFLVPTILLGVWVYCERKGLFSLSF